MAKKNFKDWSKEDLIKHVEKLEKRKKYGLVWDEERTKEIFELQALNGLPVLNDVPENAITTNPEQPTHILIEGDNYHALSVLNYTHEKAVDVIYIDPPYNTGNNDFRYNDKYVNSDDGYRHSKWISFMQKRLILARDLLKDSGLIFISIDDNEFAQLRLLCDEIFGEENFRNSIVMSRVKKNIREREFVKSLNFGHGTIIFYGRTSDAVIKIPTKIQQKKERWHSFDAPGIRKTMEYELFGLKPPKGRHWMYEENKAKDMIANGLLRPNAKSGKPEYCLKPSDTTMLDTNWTDLQEGDSAWIPNGGKNVALLKRVISMHPNKNAIVLDFFAGSGTIADATHEINQQDSGNRQSILCTNNESNICTEVCYPRVKSLDVNLKYYRTSFVPAEPSDENKELLTRQSVEMLCLRESAFEFVTETDVWKIFKNNQHYTAILFDQLSIPDLKAELETLDKPVSVYVFSLEDDNFASEFADMKDKVKVCSIPEAILRVYRRIYQ